MAWIDILYPGNSVMKEKLAELCGELRGKMKDCFTAVNKLIDCIEKHVPGQQFEKVAEQEERSLQDNCNVLIKRVNEIDEYLEKKAKNLEDSIGTDLFQQLMRLDTTFEEHFAIAKKATTVADSSLIIVGEVALVTMLKKGMILARAVAKIGRVLTGVFATVGLGVFGLAVDIIISAILGKVEKEKLEDALTEYTEAVEEFGPAVGQFYDDISMIRAKLEIMKNE